MPELKITTKGLTPTQKKKQRFIGRRIDDTKNKVRRLMNLINDLQLDYWKAGDYRVKREPVRKALRNGLQVTIGGRLIGRRYWKERFKDEGTGKYIYIERSAICSIDGKPCDEFGNLLKYYDV